MDNTEHSFSKSEFEANQPVQCDKCFTSVAADYVIHFTNRKPLSLCDDHYDIFLVEESDSMIDDLIQVVDLNFDI